MVELIAIIFTVSLYVVWYDMFKSDETKYQDTPKDDFVSKDGIDFWENDR